VRGLLQALASESSDPKRWEAEIVSLEELKTLLESASSKEIMFNLQAGS
jgi:hypothetical protein